MIARTGREHDDHFNEMAVNILQAALIFTICHVADDEHKNLATVLHYLSGSTRARKMAYTLQASPCCEGHAANLGALIHGVEPKEFGSIVTSVYKNLAYLASPRIARHLARTSFDLDALGDRMTVYLVLPVDNIDSHAPLVRLWVNTLLIAKKKRGLDETKEVLFLLDEVGNLGDVAPLEKAVSTGRGFGIRCIFIVQSIKQIESNFPPPRSDTVIAGLGFKMFFGINDLPTAEYVSKMAGKRTITLLNFNKGTSLSGLGFFGANQRGSNQGTGHSAGQRDLIAPDEVMRMPGEVLIFVAERPPILANLAFVHEDPEFQAERDIDPGLRSWEPATLAKLAPSLVSWIVALAGLWYAATYLWDHASIPIPSFFRNARTESEPDWDRDVRRRAYQGEAPALPRNMPPPAREITCPDCGNRGILPADYDGTDLTCRNCGTSFPIPD